MQGKRETSAKNYFQRKIILKQTAKPRKGTTATKQLTRGQQCTAQGRRQQTKKCETEILKTNFDWLNF